MCEFNDDYEQEQADIEHNAQTHFYAERAPDEDTQWDDLSEEEKNEFREMYR